MLMIKTNAPTLDSAAILKAAERAARAIPPLWPLASSVAVNPFLGQSEEPLSAVAARLRRVAGGTLTMPRAWYAERIHKGEIAEADLAASFEAAPETWRPKTIALLKSAIEAGAPTPVMLPTMAELAAEASGIDWTGVIAERFGQWAAGYFDAGQALWTAPQSSCAYAAWRSAATHDLTPEILGLKGFAMHVAQAPERAEDALIQSIGKLGLDEAALETYLHRLLMSLGGWAQFARYKLWQAELSGGSDNTITDLLTIRLVWEQALFEQHTLRIASQWKEALCAYATPVEPTPDDAIDAILQEATERAAQRQLGKLLESPAPSRLQARPALQMAFCIDVRSEVFRRALESLDPHIETLGFAGFFGIGILHRRFASDVAEARLPVLLAPQIRTCSGGHSHDVETRDRTARLLARAKRAWGRFKLAAVSSFAFVEAAGPIYVGKLVRDGLGRAGNRMPDDPAPRFEPALDPEARIGMAESVLKAMSLTERFAPLVLIAGHGANVINNPHASALHCGACGGYSGEVNARLLAALLNEREVRAGLAEHGIAIPDDTLFIGALHDTTTDRVTIYQEDSPSALHKESVKQAKTWLATAGALARSERALRLPRASGAGDILHRARDWAEVRPEWALAGCQAFIAAPRHRTAGRDLKGRAFLHDYDWHRDDRFAVLELILTAPVVVASWISLQYYGSTVAPTVFGAGNKLLHNVTGGIGVVEGNGGLLRAGLPWQSVHDGERIAHEPVRLTVLIEAPREAIIAILKRHDQVRALFDNKWLYLVALDEQGRLAWRYAGGLGWEAFAPKHVEPERTMVVV